MEEFQIFGLQVKMLLSSSLLVPGTFNNKSADIVKEKCLGCLACTEVGRSIMFNKPGDHDTHYETIIMLLN